MRDGVVISIDRIKLWWPVSAVNGIELYESIAMVYKTN